MSVISLGSSTQSLADLQTKLLLRVVMALVPGVPCVVSVRVSDVELLGDTVWCLELKHRF